jgi:CRP/FNR family cyclic AMP-dependent transcriptional regulator
VSTLTPLLRKLLLPLPEATCLSSLRRFTSLFMQNETADALFFIDDGLVKLTRTNNAGDKIILGICGSGDLIGEEAMSLDGSKYQADAEVLAPATLYRIPREPLKRVLGQNGELATAVIDFLLGRRQLLAQKVELLCLHDVEYRILHYLAELADSIGPNLSEEYNLPITQAELADLIGATRETTSTTLNQLERRGLIKLSRRLLTIPAPELLRRAIVDQNATMNLETA